jgi:hypothetical protein
MTEGLLGKIQAIDADVVKEFLVEALHGDLDSWYDVTERRAIYRFLGDLPGFDETRKKLVNRLNKT